jgi:hypothetical protein
MQNVGLVLFGAAVEQIVGTSLIQQHPWLQAADGSITGAGQARHLFGPCRTAML